MSRFIGPGLTAALSSAVILSSLSTAFGQRRPSVGDYYGSGPEGTIGRGTNHLPGGPSDWEGSAGFLYGANRPLPTYFRGYSSAPAQPFALPYLSNRTYEPGDGYRYPLYYNPVTRTYFYYPVARR